MTQLGRARPAIAVCAGIACFLMLGASRASADSFDFTTNNIGSTGTIGTITLTQEGVNTVQVSINMDAGFSLKIADGNDVNFDTTFGTLTSGVTVDSFDIGSNNYSGGSAVVGGPGNADGYGSFETNLSSITCPSCPNGTSSVDSMVFTVTATGLTVADLEVPNSQGYDFALHFCTASGGNCGPSTGYTVNGPENPVTPEPASMVLMGTFLLAASVLLGRKLTTLES